MKTTVLRKEDVQKEWWIVDAKDQTLGRLCTKIAMILKGKHKPNYTPHVDCGDYVVVINAAKIKLTGDKLEKKMYYNHSQYLTGLRTRPAKEMIEHYPEEMFRTAVHGMIPKSKLGRKMEKHLLVYRDANHKHEAQQLKELKL